MVEVFKTNVNDQTSAEKLLKLIHHLFDHYSANFDLTDCDRILRIHSRNGSVSIREIQYLLKEEGFVAEILGDEVVSGVGFGHVART